MRLIQVSGQIGLEYLERFSIPWNRIDALASCLVAFSATNRYPLPRKML